MLILKHGEPFAKKTSVGGSAPAQNTAGRLLKITGRKRIRRGTIRPQNPTMGR
ncbi:hypothetical protein EM6_2186 [Asticcacaulis excentricus]|uniref:Uncharacterized protein n=1 Tax=Asticcacaulis excentricus TaxID=78587 RepID=A0A3G9G8Y7_9CAUL|nr:hypothetical protein EM6_2186 [Asticcacaulis excentricus]